MVGLSPAVKVSDSLNEISPGMSMSNRSICKATLLVSYEFSPILPSLISGYCHRTEMFLLSYICLAFSFLSGPNIQQVLYNIPLFHYSGTVHPHPPIVIPWPQAASDSIDNVGEASTLSNPQHNLENNQLNKAVPHFLLQQCNSNQHITETIQRASNRHFLKLSNTIAASQLTHW